MTPSRWIQIVAAVLVGCARPGAQLAPQRLEHVTELAGGPRLHVVTVGSRGPAIVVIHGGPGVGHGYLRPEWDELAAVGRVVYYDQRGCGASATEGPFTWQAHLEDLGRVVRAEGRGRPVVLAASSWGTRLALLFAAAHPEAVSAVVLSGVPPWPTPSAIARWRAALAAPTAARLDSLERGLRVGVVAPPDSAIVARRNPFIAAAVAGRLVRAGVCDDVSFSGTASWATLPAITTLHVRPPMLALRGQPAAEGRRLTFIADGVDELHAAQPGLQVVDVPGAGHDPWFDQPALFFAAVRAFIAAPRGSGGPHD